MPGTWLGVGASAVCRSAKNWQRKAWTFTRRRPEFPGRDGRVENNCWKKKNYVADESFHILLGGGGGGGDLSRLLAKHC